MMVFGGTASAIRRAAQAGGLFHATKRLKMGVLFPYGGVGGGAFLVGSIEFSEIEWRDGFSLSALRSLFRERKPLRSLVARSSRLEAVDAFSARMVPKSLPCPSAPTAADLD